ncbi:cyclic nucleotide-binding domain-containing protein [Waterburya agarophytonicola K14]|uniref:Cyclic nucleotide-binding domain-containing protein n=1 Tax=Waterburya agarophytonicola KI4 TaxID=2874699 RepID=A0A964BLE1_9CYAN|nr:cyclic nucleotide-binding domain-containing protein [Waterburya agarophytonicola]MCC0175530.1 cyclic nucleotide-binding domain-containing protein [Waterburya agarophytonicola KI4]
MNSKLKYLTAEDYNILLEKAQVATYQQRETILKEGRLSGAIYLVRKGIVRVERAASGRDVAIAFLEPGDIFGEMSFLESVPTSAAVVAQEEVEVCVLSEQNLYSLLTSVPGLSDRFYQSLAHNLSNRLQQTTALVAHLMRRTQVAPEYDIQRTGQIGQDAIPPELIGETELFKENLQTIEQAIRGKNISEPDAQEQINKACNMLISSLREQIICEPKIQKAIGTYIFRETFPFYMLSSFFDRAFRKPGNYSSDSYIIGLLSQNEPEGDGYLGIYLDRWIRNLPTCLALKNRGGIITQTIKQLQETWTSDYPMPITSLASGAASEILDLYFQTAPPNAHVTCVDFNHQDLAAAANVAHKWGFRDRLTFIQDNLFLLAEGYSHIDIPPQQMIYSVSMANYLSDRELIRIMDWIYDRLLPNGTIILGNFHAANPDRLLLEHILEWHSIYRSAEDLEKLFSRSKFRSLPVTIQSDEFGVELYIVCTKAWQDNERETTS